MRTIMLGAVIWLGALFASHAGEAEMHAARETIDRQIRAFLADDFATAYEFAAPNIRRIYPSVRSFMEMVSRGYAPVHRPRSYSFGNAEALSATTVMQQVLLVGPDGLNYEAVYTLETQPDGTCRITGVSLRGAPTLSM